MSNKKKNKTKKKQTSNQKSSKKKVTLYTPPTKTEEPKTKVKTEPKGKTRTKYKKKTNTNKTRQDTKPKTIQKVEEVKTEPIIEEAPLQEEKRLEKKPFVINRNLIISIAVILILISLLFKISGTKKAGDNKLTRYIIQTNLENYMVNFEDEEGDKTDWKAISENPTTETYAKNKIIHIKNGDSEIEYTFKSNDSYFKYFGEDFYLLPMKEQYEIKYIYFNGNPNNKLSFISSNDSVTIKNNVITCDTSGEATIYASYNDKKIKIFDIKVSTLIVERPKEFDETKEFLSCEQYTKEENEELDSLLEYKINEVGYQTRAGAVEALRFMTLDLPYRVQYFYENGRYPYVDGEGRYYHKGLYLSSDKYNSLSHPDAENKGTWGCKIYSEPYGGKMDNGLDCSGLLCWALYNAGYDPDDARGANLLLELGNLLKSKNAIESGKVKVGDIVHNNEGESHVGMIIGIDDEYYYVAQAIWYKPNGVCISKYTKEEMIKHWIDIVLMDEYYLEDGNLTNMWY